MNGKINIKETLKGLEVKREPGKTLYLALSDSLSELIQSGKLLVDDPLPDCNTMAELLKVSPGTVTKAYQELIKQDLIVRKQKLGTFVKRIKSRSGRIVFVASEMEDPYISSIIKGISSGLQGRELSLRLRGEGADPVIDEILTDDFDGIIALAHGADNRAYQRALERNMPLVIIGRRMPDIPYVIINNFLVGYNAGVHFLSCGYNKFGCVCRNNPAGYERMMGLRFALLESGLKEDSIKVVYVKSSKSISSSELDLLFDSWVPFPEAILAHNDSIALQVYYEASKRGMAVPGDFALIGGDNYHWLYQGLELTSVDLNLKEVGRQSACLIQKEADEELAFPPGRPCGIEVEPELVIRKSTRQVLPD
jgi:DNA-binding LacI/PurR family transcriptional regulator